MANKATDYTGAVINKITVIGRQASDKPKYAYWLCRCECGREAVKSSRSLKKKPRCVDEGCAKSNAKTKHGLYGTPEYRAWHHMKQRCNNPKHKNHDRYGGRGIEVCERWCDFKNFYSDMGDKPSADHSLDRIDNEKGYNPDNCRWATKEQQMLNRCNTIHIEYKGRKMPLKKAAELEGISYSLMYQRYRKNIS